VTTGAGRLPEGQLPFVSVILPVRDEARTIGGALGPLLGGDYPAERLEVLVVDGGSTDGTREVVQALAARDARVRLVDNPRGSTPAGLNAGLAAARGEVVVRMDAHAQPAPDYLRACVAALARTGADAVGGPLVGLGETEFGEAVALAWATPFGAGDARFRRGGEGPVDTVYLGAWRREVFDRVGVFDEALARNQDYELALRIREAGGTVWLDPAIRSTTLTRSTPADLARQYFGYGLGRAATAVRHPGSLRGRQLVPAAFAAVLGVLGPAAVVSRPARRLLAFVAGAYAAAGALETAAAARRAGPRYARHLPVVFPTMHLAWGAGFWVGLWRALARRRPA